MQQNDYNKLRGLAKHINQLIASGKWNKLAKTQQIRLKSALIKLVDRVQRFTAKRKLARVLGAAVTLVSANANAQSFADPVSNPFDISTETYFAKPEFVDLDGDGDLDFFHSNTDAGAFYYQENTGTATAPLFATPLVNPFELGPASYVFTPVFGDLDNDGDFDFLATGYDDGILVYYENIGTPTVAEFADPVSMAFGIMTEYSFPNDLVDIDDDGDLDLFVTTYDYEGDGGIHMFFHENTGTPEAAVFAEAEVDPFGANFSSDDYWTFVDFADLDDDGDLDFMRVEMYGKIVYYHENIGDAETAEFEPGLGEDSPFDIEPLTGYDQYFFAPSLTDIDSDGDYDLFVSEYYGGTFFFENIGIIDDASIGDSEFPIEQISLFPNPTADFVTINNLDTQGFESIQIHTIDGREMFHSQALVKTVDVTTFPAGMYLLAIKHNNGNQTHLKFVKE